MGKYQTNYSNGWVNFSIHQFFLEMQAEKVRIPHGMIWTIISCLDSCPNVNALVSKSQHLQFSKEAYKPLVRTIAIKTKDLLQAEYQERIFLGLMRYGLLAKKRLIACFTSINFFIPLDTITEKRSRFFGWAVLSCCPLIV